MLTAISDMAGNTPLVPLRALGAFYSCHGEIYAKCEFFSPGGSVKDRTAHYVISKALEAGSLEKGGHVICLSGGNGGISSAMVCARLGLSCTVVASDNISLYDMRHIRAFGADILMTAAKLGLEGVRRKALEVQKQRGGFIYDQFSDPLCPEAHRKTTAPEIISALPVIDCFISGIGTGATVTGCGEYIKMMCPDCIIAGVEPYDSPVLSGGLPGYHVLTGIGAGFVPEVLNRFILDSVIRVRTPDALELSRRLALLEGLLCGPSSGAALAAAVSIAQDPSFEKKKAVVILPDRGEPYLDRETYHK